MSAEIQNRMTYGELKANDPKHVQNLGVTHREVKSTTDLRESTTPGTNHVGVELPALYRPPREETVDKVRRGASAEPEDTHRPVGGNYGWQRSSEVPVCAGQGARVVRAVEAGDGAGIVEQ